MDEIDAMIYASLDALEKQMLVVKKLIALKHEIIEEDEPASDPKLPSVFMRTPVEGIQQG